MIKMKLTEKQLRAYLKENGFARVSILQKGNHIALRSITFKKDELRSRYFAKVVNNLKFFHGELEFKLEA
ncbi:hypothetical protein [Bacillus toyonensis]|uniref:hypothetical protein n=1 Tax=Bacillus toyonensis TaxID=155322 RepID=UPI002E202342|nr:hypothetical protein [Bacillus toyonensis]